MNHLFDVITRNLAQSVTRRAAGDVTYARSYAFRNSSRAIPAWVQIVRKVEALMCGWFGIVSGARKTLRLGGSIGNLGTRFGDESIQHRRISFDGLGPESLEVEADCGLTVRQGGIVRIPLADHNPFQAERVGDVPIRMFFHHDFPSLHANQTSYQMTKSKEKYEQPIR